MIWQDSAGVNTETVVLILCVTLLYCPVEETKWATLKNAILFFSPLEAGMLFSLFLQIIDLNLAYKKKLQCYG